jgi:uncharacterized protein YacL
MLLLIIRLVYVAVCAGAIAAYVSSEGVSRPPLLDNHPLATFIVLMLISQSITVIDILIRRKQIEVISAIYFGLLVGVLLSYLLILALQRVMADQPIRHAVVMLTTLVLPYICISILLQTKDNFRFVIPYVEFAKEVKGGKPLVLDSSALIDGRIADLVDTHILDSPMVVPQFVLHEVQDIADSNDKARRTRGRRGLEVLSKLQNHPGVEVRVHESKRDEFKGMSVDQRLVELAKQQGGRIVTNDFNLNKVSTLQGIPVINLNDVANALKPRFLPGDRLKIKVLKEGETPGQGIGYLDDGTMVVCEQSAHLIGKDIDVIVTSVLQSSAGRMIFGRQVHTTTGTGRP